MVYEYGTVAQHRQLDSLWEHTEAGWVCRDPGKDMDSFVGDQVRYYDEPLLGVWEVYEPFVYLIRRGLANAKA